MRIICPEVVQTSAMDCGPAALKCLLEGFGVPVSYGRLREACQTDVDGTSIDTLEEVARDLGLEAEQVMLPVDYLLDPAAGSLPAIVVVRLPSGLTHFVVVWRRHGPLVQVMDPGSGRRWMRPEALLRDVYRHQMPVAAEGWREWAATGQGRQVLEARLRRLGIDGDKADGGGGEADREGGTIAALIGAALADPGWRSLAALEAAVRATERLHRAGGVSGGRQAAAVVRALVARGASAIADADWSVAAAPHAEDGTEQVQLRGAVLVRVSGRLPPERDVPALSPDLAAALAEPPARPGRDLLRLLRADGALQPTFVAAGLALAAAGTVVEAVLLRRLVDLGEAVGMRTERLAIGAVIIWLLGALLLVRVPVLAGVLGMGRRLEARLRVAFLSKLPRLGDRYLASRPTSDMAERGHSMQQ
ncbi:MAG TPA: cysteine peptidase family C39 domain-containing protein, partial [Polyangia bacterium]